MYMNLAGGAWDRECGIWIKGEIEISVLLFLGLIHFFDACIYILLGFRL